MDGQIEEKCKKCYECTIRQRAPEKSPLIQWAETARPWTRIHLDFMGPYMGHQYLIVIDSKTKWLEVFVGNTTGTRFVIKCLRQIFARFGLPKWIVTDNGTGFRSHEFEQYLRENGIKQAITAPGHPATNGQAENAVKTIKRALAKKLPGQRHSIEKIEAALEEFLMEYRNTQHCTTGVAPAEALMGRKMRDVLTLLIPDKEERPEMLNKRKEQQKENYRGRRQVEFGEGDSVLVRDYSNPNKQGWAPAVVVGVLGKRHYECRLEKGGQRKCNVEQMIKNHCHEQGLRGKANVTISERNQGSEIIRPPDTVWPIRRNLNSPRENKTSYKTPTPTTSQASAPPQQPPAPTTPRTPEAQPPTTTTTPSSTRSVSIYGSPQAMTPNNENDDTVPPQLTVQRQTEQGSDNTTPRRDSQIQGIPELTPRGWGAHSNIGTGYQAKMKRQRRGKRDSTPFYKRNDEDDEDSE